METLIIICVGFILYFLPTFLANNKKSFNGIAILNLFLGWTFIGWVIALIWSVSGEKEIKKN